MTRFWPAGLPITVAADALATPQAFTWDSTTHPVEHIFKRWRVDQLWWRMRVCREYFLVRTHTGLLVMLYRDVLGGAWYLQRLYD
jgi:hypothetical protein